MAAAVAGDSNGQSICGDPKTTYPFLGAAISTNPRDRRNDVKSNRFETINCFYLSTGDPKTTFLFFANVR